MSVPFAARLSVAPHLQLFPTGDDDAALRNVIDCGVGLELSRVWYSRNDFGLTVARLADSVPGAVRLGEVVSLELVPALLEVFAAEIGDAVAQAVTRSTIHMSRWS